jgi:uncharacterized protein YdhG (YjbR/CyaY superfamily)
MSPTKKAAKTTTAQPEESFTAEERAAIKERASEVRAAKGRKGKATAEDEASAVLEKIAEMQEPDRSMAQRVHEVILASAPELSPRLWYGMPAYAKDGPALVFFQPANKFKSRYATLGFNDGAVLDDGQMWPTAYAVMELTPAVEKQIAELVKRAAG